MQVCAAVAGENRKKKNREKVCIVALVWRAGLFRFFFVGISRFCRDRQVTQELGFWNNSSKRFFFWKKTAVPLGTQFYLVSVCVGMFGVCIHTCIHTMYTCIHTCIHTMYTLYVCMYVCMYTLYVCMYVCIHQTSLHTQKRDKIEFRGALPFFFRRKSVLKNYFKILALG